MDEDAERTIVGPRSGQRRPDPAQPLGHLLPLGTRLRDYEITGVVGEGGFGIVYLAFDHSLQRTIAVKEYMPTSMASRAAGSSAIVVKSERHLDTFKAGLKSFLNEARLLAKFDHPSLLKVYRFWEENGTAYMAMPFYEGPTLKDALAALGRAPTEAELRAWLRPLLDALTVMHAAQCFHRDIAPDNILLTKTGPLLLDFGAARRVIGDMTHALTVVLKPGYAPIEQYGDVATMGQGAWTDLYALACVVYYAITGQTPVSSVERLMDDRLRPLSQVAAGRYGERFLAAVDAALAVRPQDRPQDDAAFRALLEGDEPEPAPTVPGTLAHAPFAATERFPNTRLRTFAPTERHAPSTIPATLTAELSTELFAREDAMAPATAEAAVASEAVAVQAESMPAAAESPVQLQAGALAATRRGGPGIGAIAAIVGVLAVVAGGAWWAMQREPASSTTTAAPASAVQPVAVPPAPVATTPASPRVETTPADPLPARVEASPATPATAAPEAPADTRAASPSAPPFERREPTASTADPIRGEAPAATTAETAPARVEATSPVPTRAATNPALRDERKAAAAAARPRRESAEPVAATRPAPAGNAGRCSDILQKASLEPLTAAEAAYLKKECR